MMLGRPDGREGFGKPQRFRGEKCSNGESLIEWTIQT